MCGDAGSAPVIYERIQATGSVYIWQCDKNSGHFIQEEQPAVLAQEFIGFIDKLALKKLQ
jgi:hypothetical protein